MSNHRVGGYTVYHADRPSDVEHWQELIEALCSFAYVCGREWNRLGGERVEVPFFLDPQCTLAWEAGWDDAQRRMS